MSRPNVLLFILLTALTISSVVYASDELSARDSYELAYGLFLNDNFSLSNSLFKSFSAEHPDSPLAGSADFISAETLYKRGEYKNALTAYGLLSQRYPQENNRYRRELYYRMAECYFQMKDYDNSARYALIVLDDYPDSYIAKDSCLLLAENSFLTGKYDDAASYLTKLEKYTDYKYFDYVYYLMGRVYYEKSILVQDQTEKEKNALESIRYFNRFKNEFPDSKIINHSRFRSANVLYSLGRYKEAVAECDDIMKNEKDEKFLSLLRYFRAWNIYMTGNYDAAFSDFDEIVKDYPGDILAVWAEYKKGLCDEARGDKKGALALYEKVLSEHPDTIPSAFAEYAIAYYQYKEENLYDALTLFQGIPKKYSVEELSRASYFMSAEIFSKLNRYSDAADIYDRIATLYPDDANTAKYMKAWCMINQGDYSKSGAIYQSLIDDEKTPADMKAKSIIKLGDNFYEQGNYGDAEKDYNEAILKFGGIPGITAEAHYGIGWIHYSKNELAAAKAEFQSAKKEAQDNEIKLRADFMTANSLYGEYNFDSALEIYRGIMNAAGVPQEIRQESEFYAAWCYYRKSDFDTAISMWQDYTNTVKDRVKKAEAIYRIGWAYFRKNDFEKSVKQFDRIINDYKDTHLYQEALLKKGDSYYNAGGYKAAIDSYKELVDKFPDHYRVPEALYGIQWSYYQLGENDKAIEISREFLDKYKGSSFAPEIQYRVAEHYYNYGKYDTAIEEFNKFLAKNPKNDLADNSYYWLGMSYYNLKNYADAITAFKNLINNFPASSFAGKSMFRAASAYYQLHEYQDAIDFYMKFIAGNPAEEYKSDAYFNIAMSDRRLNNLPEAKNWYIKLIAEMPNSKLAERGRMNLAYLYQDNKEYDDAVKAFEGVIDTKGKKAVEAQFWIGDIYQAQGNTGAAVAAYMKVYENYRTEEMWVVSALDAAGKIHETSGELKTAVADYKKILKAASDKKYTDTASKKIKLLEEQIKLSAPTGPRGPVKPEATEGIK
jgi:TolA-binding protein